MTISDFDMRQLIEAGVHYGHQAHRWNPLMAQYIHSKRNGIHIIDLTQTIPMLDAALKTVTETVAGGGSILFVGTKRQAQTPIRDAAVASAQFYINQRWLGGTLTNWKTVSNSIERLNSIDAKLEAGIEGLTKKELMGMRREQAKLQASLGGIREMRGLPSMLFVIDVRKEAIAIAEAAKLGIPVVAVVDTNCAPSNVDHLIPGNDDASRAIALYCSLMSHAAIAGLQREISEQGTDLGASADGMQAGDAVDPPEAQAPAADENSDSGDIAVADVKADPEEATKTRDSAGAGAGSETAGSAEAGDAAETDEAPDSEVRADAGVESDAGPDPVDADTGGGGAEIESTENLKS